jgi:hypothetical protein
LSVAYALAYYGAELITAVAVVAEVFWVIVKEKL